MHCKPRKINWMRYPGGEFRFRQTALDQFMGLQRELAVVVTEPAAKVNTKHGHSRVGLRSPTYSSWRAMLTRCTNPRHSSWTHYGAQGIAVCKRWLGKNGFVHFLADLGPRPEGTSPGRLLDTGHYEPGNVAWMTPKEQAAEQRKKTRGVSLKALTSEIEGLH
jgi:hypothetical protein